MQPKDVSIIRQAPCPDEALHCSILIITPSDIIFKGGTDGETAPARAPHVPRFEPSCVVAATFDALHRARRRECGAGALGHLEADALGEGQRATPVEGVRLAAHVELPGVGTRLASASRVLL